MKKTTKRNINVILILAFIACIVSYVVLQGKGEKETGEALYAAKAALQDSKESEEEVQEESDEDPEEPAPTEPEKVYAGDVWSKGEVVGTITYLDQEWPVGAGDSAEELEHQAMLHTRSKLTNKVILGHCYRNGDIFASLYLLKEGDIITLQTTGGSEEYVVAGMEHMEEEDYNTAETINEIFEGEDAPELTLITCQTQDGDRGRLIVYCDAVSQAL